MAVYAIRTGRPIAGGRANDGPSAALMADLEALLALGLVREEAKGDGLARYGLTSRGRELEAARRDPRAEDRTPAA